MKKVAVILVIVVTTSIFAQNSYNVLIEREKSLLNFDNEKYDKEYFLIGMLNEYMGYQRAFNGGNYWYQKVDFTSTQRELKYLLFIDLLFNFDYHDITIVNNGASFRVYSPALSLKIDDYYFYQATGMRTMEGDTIYSGQLKKEKFETEKKKLSFLLGAYLRYGRNKDIISFSIQMLKRENELDENKNYENVTNAIVMSNASTKVNFCKEILTYFGCKDVEYVHRNSIPAGNHVFFTPSEKIQEIISEAERLNRQIEEINANQVNFTKDGTKYIWDGK